MLAYVQALEDASKVGRTPVEDSETAKDAGSETMESGPLVRLLVEAHVRRSLNQLRAIYAQLELALGGTEQAGPRTWLKDKRESLQTAREGLASLRLPGVFVLVPFVVGLVTALAKVPGSVYILLASAMLGPAYIGAWRLRDSYRRKRECLLPGSKEIDKLKFEKQRKRQRATLERLPSRERTLWAFRAGEEKRAPA